MCIVHCAVLNSFYFILGEQTAGNKTGMFFPSFLVFFIIIFISCPMIFLLFAYNIFLSYLINFLSYLISYFLILSYYVLILSYYFLILSYNFLTLSNYFLIPSCYFLRLSYNFLTLSYYFLILSKLSDNFLRLILLFSYLIL